MFSWGGSSSEQLMICIDAMVSYTFHPAIRQSMKSIMLPAH